MCISNDRGLLSSAHTVMDTSTVCMSYAKGHHGVRRIELRETRSVAIVVAESRIREHLKASPLEAF